MFNICIENKIVNCFNKLLEYRIISTIISCEVSTNFYHHFFILNNSMRLKKYFNDCFRLFFKLKIKRVVVEVRPGPFGH